MKVVGCYRDEEGNLKDLDKDREKELAMKLFSIMAKTINLKVEW